MAVSDCVWHAHAQRSALHGVGGRSSEAMPEKPPAARWVRQRGIIRVTAKEMTAAATIRSTSRGSEKGLWQVN
jgi:hypothetical protein